MLPIPKKVKKSKFKGVYWNKSRQKWRVLIKINGKAKELGHFDNEIKGAEECDTAKINQGEYTELNFPNAPAAIAARTAAAGGAGGAGVVSQKGAGSKPVTTFMGAYYSERDKTWWSTISLRNGSKKYLGSYSTQLGAATAFAYAKSIQSEELQQQKNFSKMFERLKLNEKHETHKRKRETVRSHGMYGDFSDISHQFIDIYREFDDTCRAFGGMYCECDDIYYILPKVIQPT
jgi:hypothetical protein